MLRIKLQILSGIFLPAFLFASLSLAILIFLNPFLASESPSNESISVFRSIYVWLIFSVAFSASFIGSYIKKFKSQEHIQRISFFQSIWFLIPVWGLAFYMLGLGQW